MARDAHQKDAVIAALQIQRLWRGYIVRRGYYHRWVEQLINVEVAHFQQRKNQDGHLTNYIAAATRAEAEVEAEAQALRLQRSLVQEEAFHRSRLSEWEVDERRVVYQLHLYHRLSVELQVIEAKVRKLVTQDAEKALLQLMADFKGRTEVLHDRQQRAATAIQAQWRGFRHRTTLQAQIAQYRDDWEQRCELEDEPLWLQERSELDDEATLALMELNEEQEAAWQQLMAPVAALHAAVLQSQLSQRGQELKAEEAGGRQDIIHEHAQWVTKVQNLSARLAKRRMQQEKKWMGLLRSQYIFMRRLGLEGDQHYHRQRLEQEQHRRYLHFIEAAKGLLQRSESAARLQLEQGATFTIRWLALSRSVERYHIRWQQWKYVTLVLGLCAVLYFQRVHADIRSRTALLCVEEGARAALQAEESSTRDHFVRKRDWEQRMMVGRSKRQALEAVEVASREQLETLRTKELAELEDLLQEGVAAVFCRHLKVVHIQRWMRKRLQRLHRIAEFHQQMMATRIQAAWRGHQCRKDVARFMQRREEEQLIERLQDMERRHILRNEADEFQMVAARWDKIWSSTRLKRRLLQARLQSHAARKLQHWWRTMARIEKARRARENVVERQERAGREVLLSEWDWKSKRIMAEYTKETKTLKHRLLCAPSAVHIQRVWRGHATRKRLPKFIAYKEEVMSIVRLWKIERQLLNREAHDAWEELYRELVKQRQEALKFGGKVPLRPEQIAAQEARRQELQAAAHRKKVQLEAKRRQAELNEELGIVATEERLERKSILRAQEYWFSDMQEAFATGRRQAALTPWLMSSSQSLTPVAAPLGPLRTSSSSLPIPAPPLASLLMAPLRPSEELPALKRVPLQRNPSLRSAFNSSLGRTPPEVNRSASPLPLLSNDSQSFSSTLPMKGKKGSSPTAVTRKAAAPLAQSSVSFSPAASSLPAIAPWKKPKE